MQSIKYSFVSPNNSWCVNGHKGRVTGTRYVVIVRSLPCLVSGIGVLHRACVANKTKRTVRNCKKEFGEQNCSKIRCDWGTFNIFSQGRWLFWEITWFSRGKENQSLPTEYKGGLYKFDCQLTANEGSPNQNHPLHLFFFLFFFNERTYLWEAFHHLRHCSAFSFVYEAFVCNMNHDSKTASQGWMLISHLWTLK